MDVFDVKKGVGKDRKLKIRIHEDDEVSFNPKKFGIFGRLILGFRGGEIGYEERVFFEE